eukprot:348124-Rhodomonas_salina.2
MSGTDVGYAAATWLRMIWISHYQDSVQNQYCRQQYGSRSVQTQNCLAQHWYKHLGTNWANPSPYGQITTVLHFCCTICTEKGPSGTLSRGVWRGTDLARMVLPERAFRASTWCYAMPGTDVAYGAKRLLGTELAYGATILVGRTRY